MRQWCRRRLKGKQRQLSLILQIEMRCMHPTWVGWFSLHLANEIVADYLLQMLAFESCGKWLPVMPDHNGMYTCFKLGHNASVGSCVQKHSQRRVPHFLRPRMFPPETLAEVTLLESAETLTLACAVEDLRVQV